jgi:periodic tryptophan protein 2
VRAFDLVRYRNFRTCTSPRPVQFNCLAVDPSGEVHTRVSACAV